MKSKLNLKRPKRKIKQALIESPVEPPHVHFLKKKIFLPNWMIFGSIGFIIASIIVTLIMLQTSNDIPDYMTLDKSYPNISSSIQPETSPVQMPQSGFKFDWWMGIAFGIPIITGFIVMSQSRRNHQVVFFVLIILFMIGWYMISQQSQSSFGAVANVTP